MAHRIVTQEDWLGEGQYETESHIRTTDGVVGFIDRKPTPPRIRTVAVIATHNTAGWRSARADRRDAR